MGCIPSRRQPLGHAIPTEIYSEIITHLDPVDDSQTLLAVCLCSRTLRIEGQKMLFSINSTEIRRAKDYGDNMRVVRCHTLFLSAILRSPDRLALYVRSYKQIGISLPLKYIPTKPYVKHDDKYYLDRIHVWNLSLKAIPLMKNLRRLCFNSDSSEYIGDPRGLLRQCTFQLEEFTWEPENQDGELTSFLGTQHRLRHLGIRANRTIEEIHAPLPPRVSPELISVSCDYLDFIRFARDSTILAFAVTPYVFAPPPSFFTAPDSPATYDEWISALMRLRYLRIWPYASQIGNLTPPGGLHLNIVVLELPSWIHDDLDCLAGAPRLRILSLWDPSMANLEPTWLIKQTVAVAFAGCPSLEYVIWSITDLNKAVRRYSMPKVERNQGKSVEEEVISIDRSVSSMWWEIYEI